MFSNASLNVFLMWINVSSDLPEKKSNFPRNFWSSSLMEGIKASSTQKDTTEALPLDIDNERHFDGFSFIPIDLI